MKKIVVITIRILGIFIAVIQQGYWIDKGYYCSATLGQFVCSLVWTSTLVGMIVFLTSSNKPKTY